RLRQRDRAGGFGVRRLFPLDGEPDRASGQFRQLPWDRLLDRICRPWPKCLGRLRAPWRQGIVASVLESRNGRVLGDRHRDLVVAALLCVREKPPQLLTTEYT